MATGHMDETTRAYVKGYLNGTMSLMELNRRVAEIIAVSWWVEKSLGRPVDLEVANPLTIAVYAKIRERSVQGHRGLNELLVDLGKLIA